MIRNKLLALAGSAIVTGVAGVAFATPAGALEAPDPGNGDLVFDQGTTATTTSTDDSQWLEIGLGALGGLAIAGAGVAAAVGMKRRSTVPTS
jgi:hypothetical protein